MTAAVQIRGLAQRFGGVTVLDGIDLDIAAGEFVVLLGPSGCGKTTLLNIIGGFADPSQGQVLIGGRDMAGIPPRDRPTTTVFQDYALFPHMTLRDNVAFGLKMRGQDRARRLARADQMLTLFGLDGRGAARPHELSGGQRQRVALARALAVEPDVLLLDEPLGALDLKLRRQMQDELKAIQAKVGTTFIHVTHDQEEAMAIADRIVVMNRGRIEDQGPPREVYLKPRTLFSARFMGEVNQVPVANGRTPFGPIAAPDGTLCIRPEAISLTGSLHIGLCKVEAATFFGTHVRAHVVPVAAPDITLVVHLPPTATTGPGAFLNLGAEAFMVLPG
jgi:spermidine/putrescine transport system ATP-binding protein